MPSYLIWEDEAIQPEATLDVPGGPDVSVLYQDEEFEHPWTMRIKQIEDRGDYLPVHSYWQRVLRDGWYVTIWTDRHLFAAFPGYAAGFRLDDLAAIEAGGPEHPSIATFRRYGMSLGVTEHGMDLVGQYREFRDLKEDYFSGRPIYRGEYALESIKDATSQQEVERAFPTVGDNEDGSLRYVEIPERRVDDYLNLLGRSIKPAWYALAILKEQGLPDYKVRAVLDDGQTFPAIIRPEARVDDKAISRFRDAATLRGVSVPGSDLRVAVPIVYEAWMTGAVPYLINQPVTPGRVAEGRGR